MGYYFVQPMDPLYPSPIGTPFSRVTPDQLFLVLVLHFNCDRFSGFFGLLVVKKSI